MTVKEFIEKNVVRMVVNQLHTGRTYLNPEVERLREEALENGESFFYPYFDDGKYINKPNVMYVLKKEWTEEEYNEMLRFHNPRNYVVCETENGNESSVSKDYITSDDTDEEAVEILIGKIHRENGKCDSVGLADDFMNNSDSLDDTWTLRQILNLIHINSYKEK